LLVGFAWASTFLVYQVLQTLHRNYCSANLLHAVLFSRSDACVYTASAIGLIESTSQRVLYAILLAAAYNVWRAMGALYAGGGGGGWTDTTASRLIANATREGGSLPPLLSPPNPTSTAAIAALKNDDVRGRRSPPRHHTHRPTVLPLS
jgi:hypothetical protein